MSSGNLLRLLASVADLVADEGGELRVVTVLAPDLSGNSELLRAVADGLRAVFVDVSDPAASGPVEAIDSAPLRAAIDEFLDVGVPGSRSGGLRFVLESGGLDVLLPDGTGSEVASRAERQLLTLARTFFDSNVLAASTVFLTYDETAGMDTFSMQRFWNFVVGGLPGLALGMIRTIVVLVSVAGIDVQRHCKRSSSGFTLAMSGDRILRRDSEQLMLMKVRRVAIQSQKPIVFFLGAGFSASSGLPLGNVLRDSSIRRLLDLDEAVSVGREEVLAFRSFCLEGNLLSASEAELHGDEFARGLTLEQVVRVERDWLGSTPTLDLFSRLNSEALAQPGPSIFSMDRILRTGRRVVLTTVNFDTLLESHAKTPLQVFARPTDFDSFSTYLPRYLAGSESAIPYLKLHGSIDVPETCVVTDDHTRGGLSMSVSSALNAVLELEADVVYLGASMRDRDLVPYFARSEAFAERVAEIWVSPFLDDSTRRFLQEYRAHLRAWRNGLQSHVVSETSDVFLSVMADLMSASG
jgi:hypothetical protein